MDSSWYIFLEVFFLGEKKNTTTKKHDHAQCNHVLFWRKPPERILKEWGTSEQLGELWSGEEELMSCCCAMCTETSARGQESIFTAGGGIGF